jgi:hypothetical protein
MAGSLGEAACTLTLAGQRRHPGSRERQRGMACNLLVLKARYPVPDRFDVPELRHLGVLGRDQYRRNVDVTGSLSVCDSPSDEAVLAIPPPGTAV